MFIASLYSLLPSTAHPFMLEIEPNATSQIFPSYLDDLLPLYLITGDQSRHTRVKVTKWHMLTLPLMNLILICYGCRNKYPKKPSPPNDLCLQTVEWRQYFPWGSNFPHSRWSNTYYHPRVICVHHNWPLFDPTLQVKIDSDVRSQLTNVHKNFIICELGLHI